MGVEEWRRAEDLWELVPGSGVLGKRYEDGGTWVWASVHRMPTCCTSVIAAMFPLCTPPPFIWLPLEVKAKTITPFFRFRKQSLREELRGSSHRAIQWLTQDESRPLSTYQLPPPLLGRLGQMWWLT